MLCHEMEVIGDKHNVGSIYRRPEATYERGNAAWGRSEDSSHRQDNLKKYKRGKKNEELTTQSTCCASSDPGNAFGTVPGQRFCGGE